MVVIPLSLTSVIIPGYVHIAAATAQINDFQLRVCLGGRLEGHSAITISSSGNF
jgi:hypothetical protein